MNTKWAKADEQGCQHGFEQGDAGVVPLCYTRNKNIFLMLSVQHSVWYKDEFRSLAAWGNKLLNGLVVWQGILLYLLSDGSRVNRLSRSKWMNELRRRVSSHYPVQVHLTHLLTYPPYPQLHCQHQANCFHQKGSYMCSFTFLKMLNNFLKQMGSFCW